MNDFFTSRQRCAICKIVSLFLMTLVFSIIFDTYSNFAVSAATSMKIQYNGKTINFSGQQVGVTVDGTAVDLNGTKGLEMVNSKKEEIYMVSAYDVFQQGLGASYTYSNKKITIEKFGIVIRMTVNRRTAYVNGKKYTLDFPPVFVRYVAQNKTKLLVPAQFVAKSLGYSYSWKNHSNTSATISMTTPFYLRYNSKWRKYTGSKGKVTLDDENISITDMPAIIINNTVMVQAEKVFTDSRIGAEYEYNPTTKVITITKNDITIKMKIDRRAASVNEKTYRLSCAPKFIRNAKNDKVFLIVPAYFVARNLGYNYIWNQSTATACLTRPDGIYFEWNATEVPVVSDMPVVSETPIPTMTPEVSEMPIPTMTPAVSEIPVSTVTPIVSETHVPTVTPATSEEPASAVLKVVGERKGNTEVISFTGTNEFSDYYVSEEDAKITVTVYNVLDYMGGQNLEIKEPYLMKGAALLYNQDATATLTISKKYSDTMCKVVMDGNYLTVTLIANSAIKIAVDCGHGAYTAGKRTPPLPFALDFDQDGVIDAKKGSQIREHTANVGVGKYLVEELERCGFEVYKSAFGTEDVPLSTRQANIKKSESDYSISIHYNAIGSGSSFTSGNGIEVFSYRTTANAGDSKKLASAVLNQVKNGTKQLNRGVNTNYNFAMCNTSAMGTKASILLECAFMTNLHEATTMMGNVLYWKETAQEIAKGFCDYTGMVYIPEK
ncbi:stalk domain-containing protein [Anaeromicropila populeti]|uniref:N-acetylmuramoyl-L-alanine amidase n=1 Tax=Anaeromicropila populeti TaxID=37658 RepID=A0A1I6L2I5_9FIRM|nr:stalk domain-containing protein [Anaeromicropila populeti]SFR97647.1 N-acetylmuramoyl-L-alanine amidase [Anaeromicropila populeti]